MSQHSTAQVPDRTDRLFQRAETHMVMLASTFGYVASHCDDQRLAGVLNLLAIGVEELQAALCAHKRGEPECDGLDRIVRLLPALVLTTSFLDWESIDYGDLCGVIGLLYRSVNDLHDDVTAYLHETRQDADVGPATPIPTVNAQEVGARKGAGAGRASGRPRTSDRPATNGVPHG